MRCLPGADPRAITPSDASPARSRRSCWLRRAEQAARIARAARRTPAPSRNTPRRIDQEIAHRIEVGQQLHRARHVGDRGGEAGQDDRRHQEQERAEQPLLLGDGERGDHQPDADGGEQEQAEPDIRAPTLPRSGTSNQNMATRMISGRLDQRRSAAPAATLPIRISTGRSGVTSSWSKVPASRSRATDRRGHQQGDDQRQQSDDARDDEPARGKRRIEPGPHVQRAPGPPCRRGDAAHAVVEVDDDGAGVVQRQHRGVGVAPVEDDLQRRRCRRGRGRALKRGPMCSTISARRSVDQRGDALRRDPSAAIDVEMRRAREAADQLAARPVRGPRCRPRAARG